MRRERPPREKPRPKSSFRKLAETRELLERKAAKRLARKTRERA